MKLVTSAKKPKGNPYKCCGNHQKKLNTEMRLMDVYVLVHASDLRRKRKLDEPPTERNLLSLRKLQLEPQVKRKRPKTDENRMEAMPHNYSRIVC